MIDVNVNGYVLSDLKFASRYFDLLNNIMGTETLGGPDTYNVKSYQIDSAPLLYNRTFMLYRNNLGVSGLLALERGAQIPNLGWIGTAVVDSLQTIDIPDGRKLYAVVDFVSYEKYIEGKTSVYDSVIATGFNWGSYVNTNPVFPIQDGAVVTQFELNEDLNIIEDLKGGLIIRGVKFYIGKTECLPQQLPGIITTSSNIYNNLLIRQNKSPYDSVSSLGLITLEISNPNDEGLADNILNVMGQTHTNIFANGIFHTHISPVRKIIINPTPYFTGRINQYVRADNGLRYAMANPTGQMALWVSDIQTLRAYLADWGVTLVDSALEIPPDDIADKPPSGIYNNPTPSIPSYPDDTTDTIELVSPNISPVDFLNARFYTGSVAKHILQWTTTANFIDEMKPLYSNPADAILYCRLYNLDFVKHDSAHVNKISNFTVVNVTLEDVEGYQLRLGYNTIIDGGSFKYSAYYGDYNDFVNTHFHVYVPYVGIIKIDSGDVVNRTISIKYAVDIIGDNSTYYLFSDNNIVRTGKCSLGSLLPVTSSNYNQVLTNGILSILSNVFSLNLVGAAAPFLNSHVDYKTTGTTGNLTTTQFIEPYLIIDKFPPQTPTYAALLRGNPVTYSKQINDFKKGAYIQADDIILETNATEVERSIIINLVKGGIYL